MDFLKRLGEISWKYVKWTGRVTWGSLKWTARMSLWLFIWPVGLWRSLHHSKKKGQKKAMAEVQKMAKRGEL
jgi:hypothetical protein